MSLGSNLLENQEMDKGYAQKGGYATEPSRRAEVNRIAQAYERSVPTPVTRYEVEQIISTYTNKVRNDLRAIKRMLKEGAENG